MVEISQIQNVITTTFRASGNQAIASMGTVAQGFGNIGRVINENTRLSERLNAQWRAIGTTVRYAIAGSAVFGLTRMANQLRTVQQQLGLIAAIGSQAGGGIGGAPLTDSQVTRMGNQLRDAAVTAIQPVNEMNDAAINFLSTVQGAKPSEIPTIITRIGQAAQLAQTPVEDLTKAATTMNIAFGRQNNLANISQFTRQFFALTTLAPGGRQAGPEIANQLGPLSAMFSLGKGNQTGAQSQAQMMSLVLAALRFGGTPSTSLRGLTFLTQSLIQPASPRARQALGSIGITPQSIQDQGVYANLIKFLQHITVPNRTNMRGIVNMDDDTLSQLDESGGNLPGIPASQMAFLRNAIGRIHGVRAAVILANQLQQRAGVQSLGQDLQIMDQAQKDQLQGTLNMTKAWENFRKRSRLQEASVAIQSMSLQVAQIFEPALNFAANRVSGLQGTMARHSHATRDVVLGGAAFMATMGIGRVLGVGRLPGISRIPGLRSLLGGGAGRGFVMANAAQAALSGNSTLGGTPQNPLYVVVVGQIFGGGTAAPGTGGTGTGGAGAVENTVKSWLGIKAISKLGGTAARMFGRGGKFLGGRAGIAGTALMAEAPAIPDILKMITQGVDPTTGQQVHQSMLANLLGTGFDFNSAQQYQTALRRAQKLYPGTTNIADFGRKTIQGRAEVYMTLDINQNGKITRRRVHVPVDMWSGGRTPSNKATAGSKRGG